MDETKFKEIINIFNKCLDIYRTDGITGDKALKSMTSILILKLIEPKIGLTIDIENYAFNFEHIIDEQVQSHKQKLFKIVKFSNLVNEPREFLITFTTFLWNDILAIHPATKNIFLKNNNFGIKKATTMEKILNLINAIPVINDFDILGCAYENLLKNIMQGRELGQYFTQPILKNIMIDLIKPVLKNDGTVETMCDPTLGTGGFLISYIQNIKAQSIQKNININWNFIKNGGIFGKELEQDTLNLAFSNMLISIGQPFENLECGDSIRNPINKKFDIIMSNPPFGVKGINYKEFSKKSVEINEIVNNHMPIVSNETVSLFLQTIMYMLNLNGRCCIIIPDGQDLHGTSRNYILIRKYLMHTCDLKKIIVLPSNVFTNTGVKTCILYFVKKIETNEALKIKIINNDATGNEILTKRKYEFNDVLQTKNVKFYNYDVDTKTKSLLINVSIEKIVNNRYSLNYTDYLEKKELMLNEGVKLKTIDEICSFLKKSNRPASYGKKNGKYPFFKSSMNVNSFVDEVDYDEECVILGTGGNPNIKYSNKFSCSADNIIMKSKLENVLTKYIYYYFLNNMELLQELFKGATIKHLSKEDLKKIKIPIPNVETQQNIINHSNEQNDKIMSLKTQMKECIKSQKKFMNELIIKNNDVEHNNVEHNNVEHNNVEHNNDKHKSDENNNVKPTKSIKKVKMTKKN